MPLYTYTTTTSSSYSTYSSYYYYNTDYSHQSSGFSFSSRCVRYVFSQKELNTILKAFAEDDYTWSDGAEITENTYPEYFRGACIIVFYNKTIQVV